MLESSKSCRSILCFFPWRLKPCDYVAFGWATDRHLTVHNDASVRAWYFSGHMLPLKCACGSEDAAALPGWRRKRQDRMLWRLLVSIIGLASSRKSHLVSRHEIRCHWILILKDWICWQRCNRCLGAHLEVWASRAWWEEHVAQGFDHAIAAVAMFVFRICLGLWTSSVGEQDSR